MNIILFEVLAFVLPVSLGFLIGVAIQNRSFFKRYGFY